MKERASKEYVRGLIRTWNELRKSARVAKLQASDWQFFPTRPNNFPTLRISAANSLLDKILKEDLFRSLIQTVKTADNQEEARKRLAGLLTVRSDPFWIHHYDFDQPTKREMVALGISRINELLVNAVIPIALLYARIFKDIRVRENTLRLYDSFPPAQENSLTRLMQQQLVRGRIRIDGVGKQQGLIQLYKYYCVEGRCDDCEIGLKVFAHD